MEGPGGPEDGWGLPGDEDLDECWVLMRYRHSPVGVL